MQKKRKLVWQLFPTYLFMVLVALLAVAWLAFDVFHEFYYWQAAQDLEARVKLVNQVLAQQWEEQSGQKLQALCKTLGTLDTMRISVVAPDGRVMADSDFDNPWQMENHADRPEIQTALKGQTGIAQRFSHTLEKEMLYVAMPFRIQQRLVAVVRVAIPLHYLSDAFNQYYHRMSLGFFFIALLAAGISWGVSRKLMAPLERIKQGAQRFARGDFLIKLYPPSTEELASLTESLNQMALQLDERFRTIQRQRTEQEAVFSSMVESVLVVDLNEKLLRLNPAAATLFALDLVKSLNRPIQELIRNPELQLFVELALNHPDPQEAEILLSAQEQRILWASGSRLLDESGKSVGALIVLNDMSRQRKLENLRQEFVANVSHELKTPVTVIQGYIETLLDGALADPVDAKRFLKIMLENSQRLHSIIEDLLSLSRIEQLEDISAEYDIIALLPILQKAVESLAIPAKEKKITVEIQCTPEFSIAAKATLLEQAIINLVDNAIKYSDPQSVIRVRVEKSSHAVLIRVQDPGCGIAAEHLPRVFERFYRVDKSRSRKAGGTGLGLSIVKHIVQAHGGEVRVESQVGKGSTFTIQLPDAF